MADVDPPPVRAVAPVASVWCRQVDNEAESPGYTTIPDDFAGLRETLEAIRIVGNLTVNVADTHDYWDPGHSQSLSFYPNLFLYPAAGQRYTCVGRMFLSTEDRPRLGMKTLVFSTQELLASGDFGGMVLRAHATMDGRGEIRRLAADPEPAVYQAVGEGFLFGKGTTDPVVVIASDQWEAAAQTVLELVGTLPAALVALGAFLVFPYFLPAPKVNLPELAEQLPTALAVMRVARGEAAGDRYEKRLKSWEELSVSLKDLTRPPTGKKAEALPLVLQYVRDHEEEKVREVSRRVDAVEVPRLGAHLADGDRVAGRDRRKEMWRIGAAMETAALLLSKPKGRSVSVSGEAGRRANEYLQARPRDPSPSEAPVPAAVPSAPVPPAGAGSGQHPAWLRAPPQVAVAIPESVGVPVPTGDDPSLLPAAAAVAVPAAPPAAPVAPVVIPRKAEASAAPVPPPADLASIDARIAAAFKEEEARFAIAIETRLREGEANLAAALKSSQGEITSRLGALEARPTLDADEVVRTAEARSKGSVEEGTAALRTAQGDLAARLGALEARPAVDPAGLARDLESRAKAIADERTSALKLTQNEFASRLGALEGRPAVDPAGLTRDLESRAKAIADERVAALKLTQNDLASRLGALEGRPAVDPGQIARDADARARAAADARAAVSAGQADLTARLAALEARPAIDPAQIARDIDGRVKAAVDERAKSLGGAASQAATDAWSSKFAQELKSALEQFDARAAKSEEELRAALVAQLDVELSEAKEQGTALREEIEARVRKIMEERADVLSQRTSREIHDLEQRLSVLVEGRAKDLETRLGASVAAHREKLAGVADERVARAEQRIALEREARLGEITEAQTEALAGLQVRMQSFVESKVREGLEKERDQSLALFARMKLEVEQSLARTVDAGHLDSLLNERFSEMLERAHADQSKAVAAAVAQTESRVRDAQQELLGRLHHLETTIPAQAVDVGHIERTVRRELDDFDRRLKVVHDHILPMVRQTWLKVSQQEYGGSLREMRQSLEKEIQRVEATLVAENDQLRERLETAVAQHGRIWLNLIQQMSREDGSVVLPNRGRGRTGVHRAARVPIAQPPVSDGSFPPPASSGYSARPAGVVAAAPSDREAETPERRRARRAAP